MKKIDHRVATAGMFVFVSSSHIYYFTTSSSSVTHIHTRTHARTHARTHMHTFLGLPFLSHPLPPSPKEGERDREGRGCARTKSVAARYDDSLRF